MSRYQIQGGLPLNGEVSIRGAKNASFKQIIASLLSPQPTCLYNLPDISDVHITVSVARSLGAQVNQLGPHGLEITAANFKNSIVPNGTGEKSRTSFMFAAPLLARTGEALVPIPGGDRLGARPLDRLFDCYRQMGITVEESDHSLAFHAQKITGTHYVFPKPSHTVTEVVLMTAALASGDTVLENSAQEPEIDDLIVMLNSMGARIARDPNNLSTIRIQGVTSLSGTEHQVIADRNEAVTFACAALATKGSISILRINPQTINTFLTTIETMGARVNRGYDEVTVSWVNPLKPINIETTPEPGFMTDWQAVFSLVLSQAVGVSTVIERIYPSRFQHIATLNKMGVKTTFFNPQVSDPATFYHFNPESDKPEYFHGVKICGPSRLSPAQLEVSDLRAGATATLAALTATGQSTIMGVEYIERGYEKLAERLRALNAKIEYIKT
jgi:UDP-N-acetylglucosamine 1-carboxyvinyltransferase